MTTVKERFPALAEAAPMLATTTADLKDVMNLIRLTSAVSAIPVVAHSAGGPQSMAAVALAISRELIDARNEGLDQHEIDLLLLAATAHPLEWFGSRYRIDEAWRWAALTAADEFSLTSRVEMDLSRPFNAAATAAVVGVDLLIRWVGSICYMAWAHGYMAQEATIVADLVQPVLLRALEDGVSSRRAINVSHIAVWQSRCGIGDPGALMARLAEVLADETQERDARIAAGRALASSVGELSGVSRQQRALDVLATFPDLHPTERLHLIATGVAENVSGLRERFDELASAVDAHIEWVFANSADALDVSIARGRGWGMVLGPIADLVRTGEVTAALDLVGRWFGLPEGVARSDAVLVVMREKDAVRWARQGYVVDVPADSSQLLYTMNEVLDTSLVDPADVAPAVRELRRGGRPDLEAGAAMQEALTNGLQPAAAADVALEGPARPRLVSPGVVGFEGW